MSATTSIEWTDRTWNPVRGCSVISPGCVNCYAMKFAHRFSAPGRPYHGLTKLTKAGPQWTGAIRTVDESLLEPLSWRRPQRIFVNSMGDLFHENVPDVFIDQVFAVMALAPRHTFQILTKRAARMRQYMTVLDREMRLPSTTYPRWRSWAESILNDRKDWATEVTSSWPLPNVWLGVSVEDQKHADERIPLLLQTPAAVRFVSYEPALGPVDLQAVPLPAPGSEFYGLRGVAQPLSEKDTEPDDWKYWTCREAKLDWVIAGGESGPHARPAHPDWFRVVRNQCQAAGVPFFFKQWGEWNHGSKLPRFAGDIVLNDGRHARFSEQFDAATKANWPTFHAEVMARVGKKFAGRELDGRTWDEFPT